MAVVKEIKLIGLAAATQSVNNEAMARAGVSGASLHQDCTKARMLQILQTTITHADEIIAAGPIKIAVKP